LADLLRIVDCGLQSSRPAHDVAIRGRQSAQPYTPPMRKTRTATIGPIVRNRQFALQFAIGNTQFVRNQQSAIDHTIRTPQLRIRNV
jgi:hypothetical protein